MQNTFCAQKMIERISTTFFYCSRYRKRKPPSITRNRRSWLIALLLLNFVTPIAVADKVRILENPDEAVQARIDLIQQARSKIDAQYYVVGNDYFTLAGLALLRDAARRGCEVRLIIDGRSNMLNPA